MAAALLLQAAAARAADTAAEANDAVRARDYARAATLWSALAERGDRDARYQLGSLYRTGRGVPRDPGHAFQLWLEAAEAGDARAQFGVAGLYASGWGVASDREQALRWYRAAAAQGHEGARARPRPGTNSAYTAPGRATRGCGRALGPSRAPGSGTRARG